MSYASKLYALRLVFKIKHFPHKNMSGPNSCNFIQYYNKAHWIFITFIFFFHTRDECLKLISLKNHPKEVPPSWLYPRFIRLSKFFFQFHWSIVQGYLQGPPQPFLSLTNQLRLPSCPLTGVHISRCPPNTFLLDGRLRRNKSFGLALPLFLVSHKAVHNHACCNPPPILTSYQHKPNLDHCIWFCTH